MDPLADLARLLQPHEVHWKTLHGRGTWRLALNPLPVLRFCLLTTGSCWVLTDQHARFPLQPGDFLLWAPASGVQLASARDLDPVNTPLVLAVDEQRTTDVGVGDYPAAELVGGFFGLASSNVELMDILLPEPLLVSSHEPGAERLATLLPMIGEESSSELPARDLILSRLIELMLLEALRHRQRSGVSGHRGLLGGMADPRLEKSLRAMHRDIAAMWKLADLAREAGMSRSSFVRTFHQRVGLAPMEYLISWRMALAKAALVESMQPISEIAIACGYQSDSAFNTAFRRVVGVPPGHYRRSVLRIRPERAYFSIPAPG